jgi:hypothetical protein
MRSHEAAKDGDDTHNVDFCWDPEQYKQMNNTYGVVHNNASAKQAFRAGFREGVKLALDGGVTVDPRQLKQRVHDRNYKRLLVWASVGSDIENGLWAMYGTRLGCYMANIAKQDFDFTLVRDFEWHDSFWKDAVQPQFAGGTDKCLATGWTYDKKKLQDEIFKLGEVLRSKLGLEIAELDINGSRMIKESWINPPRLGALVKENQVDNTIN